MATLLDKITGDIAILFNKDMGLAEEVQIQRGSELPRSIPVIFRVVSEDDQIETDVYGDVCFILIHENDLSEYFDRMPKKDDKITRTLPLAEGQIEREEIWTLVGEFQRFSSSVWKCLAQKNVRLYPKY